MLYTEETVMYLSDVELERAREAADYEKFFTRDTSLYRVNAHQYALLVRELSRRRFQALRSKEIERLADALQEPHSLEH